MDKKSLAAGVISGLMLMSSPVMANEALATKNACLACHQVAVKVVGPSYKDIAAKYKGDAAAVDMLVGKIKEGGVGTWGEIPMPPNAALTDEDAKTLISWVLSQ